MALRNMTIDNKIKNTPEFNPDLNHYYWLRSLNTPSLYNKSRCKKTSQNV